MTLNTYILWQDNSQIMARFPEGDTRALKQGESLNVSGSGRRVIFLAPSAAFIRRSHPKPFSELAKLHKILPSLLQHSLFKKAKMRSLIVPESLQNGQFTSFSLEENSLKDYVNTAGAHIAPVLHVAPMAMGAKHFIQSGASSIVIAPEGTGVTLSFFSAQGHMLDFRHIAKKLPSKEIQQTLQAWLINVKEAEIFNLTTRKVTAPEGTTLHGVKVDNTPALVHGFYEDLHGGTSHTMMNVWDPNSLNALSALASKLKWPLRAAIASGLILVAIQGALSLKLQASSAAYTQAIETVFHEALPGIPMVEPALQMSRRASELAVMTGTLVGKDGVILENMLALQDNIKAAGINLQVERMQLSETGLSLHGQAAGLSQVDELNTIMGTTFPHWKSHVKDVKLNSGGKATFILIAAQEKDN